MTAAERKRRQREKEKTYRDTRSDAKKVRVAIWNALWQQVFSEIGDCDLSLLCNELDHLAIQIAISGYCMKVDDPEGAVADLLSLSDFRRESLKNLFRSHGRFGYEKHDQTIRQFFFEALKHPDPWAYWEDVDAAEQAANETN
jgi:hypothetical protein